MAKAYNTQQHKPQLKWRFCVTVRAGVQPIGRRPPRPTDQTAILINGLPFNDLHSRNLWITTRLPPTNGWKAELAWLVDP